MSTQPSTSVLSSRMVVWRVAFSLIMTAVGAGIFAIPSEVRKVGFLPGSVFLVVVASLTWYATHLLQKALHIPPQPLLSFVDLGKACFGTWGAVLYEFCMQCLLLFVCAILLLLMASSLQAMVPSLSRVVWTVLVACIALPFSWVSSMKYIGYLASVGVAALLVLIAICVVVCPIKASEGGEEVPWVKQALPLDYAGVAAAFLFSFGAPSVIPDLNRSVPSPQDTIPKSINLGFGLMVVLYASVSILGSFVAEGASDLIEAVAPPDEKDALFFLVRCLVQIMALFHYVVVLAPIANSAERLGKWVLLGEGGEVELQQEPEHKKPSLKASPSPQFQLFVKVFSRSTMVVLTALLACVTSRLGVLVSIAAGLFGVFLILINPCISFWRLSSLHGKQVERKDQIFISLSCVLGGILTVTATWSGVSGFLE